MQRRRDERGAAVVEFALILPVLVLFVFGIIQFGQAYSARIELTSAVREGARLAALGNTTEAAVAQATKAAAKGLNANDIQVTYTASPGSSCAGASSTTTVLVTTTSTTMPTGTVVATYDFRYDIPLFGTGTWTLSATGVMRCGA